MADHASLTGAELHEPKGVETALSDQIYVANGAGSGVWKSLDHTEIPVGSAVGFAYAETSTYTSTGVQIPNDDTIPQNSEGIELLTVTYTPKKINNIIEIKVTVSGASSGAGGVALAVFRNTDVNALGAVLLPSTAVAGSLSSTTYIFRQPVAALTSTVYKLRFGPYLSGETAYINGNAGRIFGGAAVSSISVTEFKT